MQQRAQQQRDKDEIARKLQVEQEREAAQIAAIAASKLVQDSDIPPPPEVPTQFYTLGSMSIEDNRSLLVTLTNNGACVDRIELMARDPNEGFQYRSLDSKYGYPGYLAFKEVAGGLRIQNVPTGSPAKIARNLDPTLPSGLKPGDVVTQVGEIQVRNLADYYAAIRKTEPGKSIQFTIQRRELSQEDSETTNLSTSAGQNASEPAAEISEAPDFDELSGPARKSIVEQSGNSLVELTEELLLMKPESLVAQNDEADLPVASNGSILKFDVGLIEQPLDVIRNSNHYPAEQVTGNFQRGSLLSTLASIEGVSIPEGKRFIAGLDQMLQRNWIAKPSDDGNSVEFEMPMGAFLNAAGIDADLTIVKRYFLKPLDVESPLQNYDFELTTTIRNNRDKPVKVALRQEGLSGLTIEGWWYSVKQAKEFMNAAGARDVIVARKDSEHELFTRRSIQTAAKATTTNRDLPILGPVDRPEARSLRYIGVDSQYFVAAILPPVEGDNALDGLNRAAAMAIANVEPPDEVKPYKDVAMNIGYYFDTPAIEVMADKPISFTHRIFAGPKDPPLLASYGLSDTIYYGWSIFALVARPLSSILHFFYSLVMNYGIAIMMLTVLVRSCMFPLSWRAAAMGQRMQEMAPEIKKINEQYKDDFQKRGVETQKLYKKYKMNPMASCLPVFIQLPIFIGLYRTVSTDVALRQKPLIAGWDWCSNLAGPDQFLLWPAWMPEMLAGKGTGWFGPYFNLLPIVTCLLFIIQQKVLMPKATDEQALMTQRIMMFMTVFMGVLFFRVPAGLCIYFITSSIWSLVERTLVKKFLPSVRPAVASDGTITVQAIETPAYKAKTTVKSRATAGKPPEKLSEVFPWLKRQFKGNEAPEPTRTQPARPANKSSRPKASGRNRKKSK